MNRHRRLARRIRKHPHGRSNKGVVSEKALQIFFGRSLGVDAEMLCRLELIRRFEGRLELGQMIDAGIGNAAAG